MLCLLDSKLIAFKPSNNSHHLVHFKNPTVPPNMRSKVILALVVIAYSCLIYGASSEDDDDSEDSGESAETTAKPKEENNAVPMSKTCPAGWIRYKYTKCVKYFEKKKSQAAAQKACEALEANLASVANSMEDIDFMVALMNKATLATTLPESAWLGGMKRKYGRWFWLDLSWFQRERYYLDYDLRTHSETECLVLKSHPEPASRYVSPPGKMMIGIDGHKLNVRLCDESHSYFCQTQIEIPVQRVIHEYL